MFRRQYRETEVSRDISKDCPDKFFPVMFSLYYTLSSDYINNAPIQIIQLVSLQRIAKNPEFFPKFILVLLTSTGFSQPTFKIDKLSGFLTRDSQLPLLLRTFLDTFQPIEVVCETRKDIFYMYSFNRGNQYMATFENPFYNGIRQFNKRANS